MNQSNFIARKASGQKSAPVPTSPSRPELFFGLVGAVGTDLARTQEWLEQALRAVGYTPLSLRLSSLLSSYFEQTEEISTEKIAEEDKRITHFMELGDRLRSKTNGGDAVTLLAIPAVRNYRQEKIGDATQPLFGHAFILNSLKHPDEVEMLRRLYGDSFFVISTYSPVEKRLKALKKKIAKSYMSMEEENFTSQARDLINVDQKRPGNDLGQNVRDTFPLADIFISSERTGRDQIKRFIDLLFGNPFITPTIDEHGMFHAKAASLRSADLSRQVGALITTKKGEFIAAGCNEVPSAGGGAYWEGSGHDRDDDRDFRHGRDANAVMKYEIVSEVFRLLIEKKWISPHLQEKQPTNLTEMALNDKDGFSFKDARIASLIEFGRIVHAEMTAITEAARRGIPIIGSTLYCTTFPCHMCARHIIASGVDRVVYIEPYPKSMTKDLYKFSVRVEDDKEALSGAVAFEPFVGVAPSVYMKFFSMPKRKDKNGYTVSWDAANSAPRFVSKSASYIASEAGYIEVVAITMPNDPGDQGDGRSQ